MKIELIMLSKFGKADGGRETWAYGFIPLLMDRRRDIHCTIFGYRNDDQADVELTLSRELSESVRNRLKTNFLKLKRTRLPLIVSMAIALAKQSRPTVPPDYTIGVGGLFELLLVQFFRRGRKAASVIWLRGIFVDEKAYRIPRAIRPIVRWVEALLLSRSDILLANGDDIAAHYQRYGLFPTVIKNGVSLDKWRTSPPTLRAPYKVAFIGRLAQVKGIAEFCSLVEMISSGPLAGYYDFEVIGDGVDRPRVEELARRGLLKFHGPVSNDRLPVLLSDIDVCVALTFSSAQGGGGGTSNALLEQMAAGRVIVAWDNPHFRQLIDSRMAYLVDQGSVAALVDALAGIVNDPGHAMKVATAAQHHAENFTLERQVDLFLATLSSHQVR